MDFYDFADISTMDKSVEDKLGFKRIFLANRDSKLINVDNEKEHITRDSVCMGLNKKRLVTASVQGAKAIIITDSRINRELMEHISRGNIVLCMPLSNITSTNGLNRTKRIYMMSKLLNHARKNKIDVSFISMARSNEQLLSYAQLIELAKLIGADEQYARNSLSIINKRLGV